MDSIEIGDVRFRIALDGPEDRPVVMLSNSLGTSLEMWEAQIPGLCAHYRVLRYDNRGHGGSSTPEGPYSIEMLARDAVGILDALAIERAHWCGLSLGGMIGQWLAARMPQRFDRVILADTAAYYADPSFWHERIATVRQGGLQAISTRVVGGWLSPGFRAEHPETVARMTAMLLETPGAGYIATCEALAALDNRALLPLIEKPTLVIAGLQDQSTPVSACEFIAKAIPGGRLETIDAAHISNVEQPEAFLSRVLEFLGRTPSHLRSGHVA